jgi:hypothetical protein
MFVESSVLGADGSRNWLDHDQAQLRGPTKLASQGLATKEVTDAERIDLCLA